MRRLFISIPGVERNSAAHSFRQVSALLLLLCMLVFGTGVAYSLAGIRQHNALLEQRNYEVPWSLMQLQLEMSRFLDAVQLRHAGAIEHEELMLRYDILWSRTPVLLSNQLKDTLSDRPDLWLLIQQIENRVRSIEPMVKTLQPGALSYRLLMAELSPYVEPLSRTVTAAMHSNVLFYAEYDQAYRELGRELYICISGLALCAVLLLLMLWLQLLGYRHRLLSEPLTGLPNRFALQHRLERLLERSRPFSLTLLELESFSRIHQQFGFEVADQLLQAFARRLNEQLEENESIALLDRKTVVVVAEGVMELAAVREQLARLRQSLTDAESIEYHDFYMEPVVGVVLYPADANNMVELLARGELALELCRRDQLPYVIFDPSLLKEIERRQQLAQELPAALESDSLTLRFHPVADGQKRCAGLRLSLQWRHPRFGMITGRELSRVTEQYQLSERLLLWVLERVCESLPEWRRSRPELFVAVPLLPSVFRPATQQKLQALLARYGIEGNALALELTEDMVMKDSSDILPMLQAWRAQGVRITLADFGNGASSWGALSRLPLDMIQLDPSFCAGIDREGEPKRQLAVLFELARLLQVVPLCCGVHSEAERQVIAQLTPAALLQGPLVGSSLTALEVRPWLESRTGAQPVHAALSPGA